MKKLFTLAMLGCCWACKKNDTIPAPSGGIFIITVNDATKWDAGYPKGDTSAGATVQLFASRADYLAKKPAFSGITNASGVVTFNRVPAGTYFVLAFKGEKTNTWDDGKGQTMVSDTLFQTEAEIRQAPVQQNAFAGDFRFRDLNGDGIISATDVTAAPFDSTTLTDVINSVVKKDILIGYKSNSQATFYKSTDDIETDLFNVVNAIKIRHLDVVMRDAMLSDDADCSGFDDWCVYDRFAFGATSSPGGDWFIWNVSYNNILKLNRMLLSLQKIEGDNATLIAQIRSIRAFVYLDLHTYYGDLPLVQTTTIPLDISRASAAATRGFIKKELIESLPSLPAAAPADKQWQFSAAAANMLLARTALLEKDATAIIAYTNSVIASRQYKLADSTAVFLLQNNTEIIWDLTIRYGLGLTFKDFFVRGGLTVEICPTIRYTETYLLNALAYTMINDIDGATKAINTIRTRGKKPAISFFTIEGARNEAESLYREELYREGFRFAHLVSTGQAMQVLSGNGYREHNALMPIHIRILSAYPNIHQNPGY